VASHNIMHMIASLVAEDMHAAVAEHRQPDPERANHFFGLRLWCG
jgi:hypothetical protein